MATSPPAGLPVRRVGGSTAGVLHFDRLTAGEPVGGADRDRTGDLLVANQALSQLSYSPGCPEASGPQHEARDGLGGPKWI